MSNLTLELDNVTYRYASAAAPAVSNVSCAFKPGMMYSVVGPSGSGKSTLLSLLAGLDLPTQGIIRFDDTDISTLNLDRYRRESVSMIFQAFHLFSLLTVMENVCYPLELCGIAATDAIPRAKRLLENVSITPEQMKRFPAHLSGGEQQRVAIARSLAAGAKTILADEPTGNLDVENTKNIMDILLRLAHDEKYCVIIVTHDLEAAESADVVHQMRGGVFS